ncbi:hypothetical protein OROMI_016469 [Orobanche minor]
MYFSVVAPGDTVHVICEFDALGKCDVNHEKNFLIFHPYILVSGTRVSASFSCPRPTILDERLKHSEHSAAALLGTLLHQIFQTDEKDIWKTLIEAIPRIMNWISYFRDSEKWLGYMMNIEYGLLYYLHTDQTQGISVRRSDLIGLIMRLNELANDLLMALTTQKLPQMEHLWLQNEHTRTFATWIQNKIVDDRENNVPIDETMKFLANKPRSSVLIYPGYHINGCNFATKDRDNNHVTQNSGVRIVANTLQISSSKYKRPHSGDMAFYGVIDEIW